MTRLVIRRVFIMIGILRLPVGHFMVGHPMVRHLVALQRVLGPKLRSSIIISYSGVGILGEIRTRLERCSNIGRSYADEGKSNDVTKRRELRKRVSRQRS